MMVVQREDTMLAMCACRRLLVILFFPFVWLSFIASSVVSMSIHAAGMNKDTLFGLRPFRGAVTKATRANPGHEKTEVSSAEGAPRY